MGVSEGRRGESQDHGPHARSAHADAVTIMQERLRSVPHDASVRLDKPTSNLFRFREQHAGAHLDARAFAGVLAVDPVALTADVGGMTTYEQLVDATLPYGLMPRVVPQLKTITIGGAIAGLGIESTSFRNGLVHESALEMEILTGEGRVVLASRDNEHSALFYGFPNSYGTLGYLLRVVIELEPVRPAVLLRHVRYDDAAACAGALTEICRTGRFDGLSVDFLDGTVFGRRENYLTVATFTDATVGCSDYTGQHIYFRSIAEHATDSLRARDYLWRWDTDWFWCSRALGVQNPLVRAFVPRRYLRSDVYRRVVAGDRRYRLSARARAARGLPPQEPVIQDIEVPVDRLAEFLDFFHREIGITPIWICPLRTRYPVRWSLYPLEVDTLYVNVGFWSSVTLANGEAQGTFNRKIERAVIALGGHKSLYSTSFFGENEFWSLYNGREYAELKRTYDPGGRLPDLYEKCVRGR